MTDPKGLGHQRRTDHLHQVASPKKRVGADQHVCRRATNTTRTARPAPLVTARPPNHPPPRRPPRTQTATATRTLELTRQQRAFDFERVGSYDLQQCLRAPGRTLPTLARDKREGPCAYKTHAR